MLLLLHQSSHMPQLQSAIPLLMEVEATLLDLQATEAAAAEEAMLLDHQAVVPILLGHQAVVPILLDHQATEAAAVVVVVAVSILLDQLLLPHLLPHHLPHLLQQVTLVVLSNLQLLPHPHPHLPQATTRDLAAVAAILLVANKSTAKISPKLRSRSKLSSF